MIVAAKSANSFRYNPDLPKYVLITPARNEADFIEGTIASVLGQTALPTKWIIVSDGSTDGTDDIVKKYSDLHDWIELVRVPERRERHFAGKVYAFRAGCARLQGLDYDVIGSLDADITFDRDYFNFLLRKFSENPRLGMAGTPFREGSHQYDYRFTSIEHVSGACQLFRRECFEDIGGYTPIKIGGIDLVAGLTARMKGWQTRTFPEKSSLHHRAMGRATRGAVAKHFRGGEGDFMLGGHPLWEFCRCCYQMKGRPVVIGGSLRLAGFLWGMIVGREKVVPPELVRFRRQEQMKRLRAFFRNMVAHPAISRPS